MAKKTPQMRSALETEIFANRYTQADVGKAIGRSVMYISNCINGKRSFTIAEAYKILEMLGRDSKEIGLFFPPEEGRKNK